MCIQGSGPTEKSLTTLSGTAGAEPATGWTGAMGVDNTQAVVINTGLVGNFVSCLAIQTADVRTDDPNAWQELDSYNGSGAHFTEVEDISTYTADAQFFRLGVMYKLSTGSNLARAQVSVQAWWTSCGQIVGALTFQAAADEDEEYFEPVTDFVPTLGITDVKAAIVVSGVSGDFQSRLVYRTANTVVQGTGSWTPLEGGFTSGAGERNTGEIPLTPTSDNWIQIGIGYKLSSAGSVGQGTVTASVAVRRST